MSSRWIALAVLVLLASHEANAACVIHGARPTVPLPTMMSGQEFSFIASPDCEALRFTIRGTDLSKNPQSGGSVGPGPQTYKVHLTESEWDAVVAESGSSLTWIVAGRTSAGVTTRMVTANDLKRHETIELDLSMADAKLVSEEREDYAGISVSGAGDVDGDGHDDLLIGVPHQEGWRGAAYLVLGPVTGTRNLALADAKLVGEHDDDAAGVSVSRAGDVDGDGHDDLLIGAWYQGSTGAAYVVHGPVSGTLDLSLADAKLVGEAAQDQADIVSDAGDLNDDGHDDLLVGAPVNDEGGRYAGAAYVVLGPVSGTLDLSLADAKLVGDGRNDTAGFSVSDAGDIDGDGQADIAVGATGYTSGGGVYVVSGPVTGTFDLSLADATLAGEPHSGAARVAGAGDVDGDGHDDLLVGAEIYGGGPGTYSGAAYLVLGPVTGTLRLTSADAKLVGEEEFDLAGTSVSGAGDVDGDGHDDLLVGASGNDEGGADAGAAYLLLGPVSGTSSLSRADAKFVGERDLYTAGMSVSGAGDVDGDGQDDLLIGAPAYYERDGAPPGAAYLIYGGGL
jgi:hypothetical protein